MSDEAKLERVTFRVRHNIYNAGETAGFPSKMAENLVGAGVADWADKKADPEPEKLEEDVAKEPEKPVEQPKVERAGGALPSAIAAAVKAPVKVG